MAAKTVGIKDTHGVQHCIENTPSCVDCERYVDRCSDILVDNLLENISDGRILVETLALTLVKAYIIHFGACTPEEDMEGILGITRLIADIHMDDIEETYDQDWLDFGIVLECHLLERDPISEEDDEETCPYCGRYDLKRFWDLPAPESFVGIANGIIVEPPMPGHGHRVTITIESDPSDTVPERDEWNECIDEFIEYLKTGVPGRLHDAAMSEPIEDCCHPICDDQPDERHDCDPTLCGGCCDECAYSKGIRRYRFGSDGKIHVIDHRGVLDGQ